MHNSSQQINRIQQLAWTLSLASARRQWDTPGEYVWAFPESDEFEPVRSRSRSIFSSGNAIKDSRVLDFIQQQSVSRHMTNPWIVQEFEDYWPDWIQQGSGYRLRNLELYRYRGFSQGTQESFLNFYMMHRDRRFRVFRGDYWWHMDIWQKIKQPWAYLGTDELRPGDICIVSCPFALTGRRHPHLANLLDECDIKGIPVMLDFIYLPNSMDLNVDLDLARDCIDTITFSLSKTFPVQCAKIAIRMRRNKPADPMQMSNDENICNRLSAGLGLDVIRNFAPDYMVHRYREQQQAWCDRLGLEACPVVHFALGPNYTEWGRSDQRNWCSPFNEQGNRYNLGILYENPKLLANLAAEFDK